MRRIMLRVEDDLHRRITDAAYDARQSTNRWLTGVADDATRATESREA